MEPTDGNRRSETHRDEHAKSMMRQAKDTTGDAVNMQTTSAHTLRTGSVEAVSSSAVFIAYEAPPPALGFSVFNSVGGLTFDFARVGQQRAPPPADAGLSRLHTVSHGTMTTALPGFPQVTPMPLEACSSDFSSTLPSLSEALRLNRAFGDDSSKLSTPPEKTTTLMSASDWDEILGCVGDAEEYVSPDVALYFQNQQTLRGSQELDVTGREFLESPAIPVTGAVPRKFGDVMIPAQLAAPAPMPLDPPPMRYALREKPRAAQVYPLLHSLTLAAQQASAALRPLSLKAKRGGKSARTRLFPSPPSQGQENIPQNIVDQQSTKMMNQQSLKSVTKPAPKKPQPRERRSLDSAMPEPAPPSVPAGSLSARKWKECLLVGCKKGARSKGLCKRHGGGKRCSVDGCSRSDQGGGRCISHGGGRRCAFEECKNSAQSRGLCKSHGGGKRCSVLGCTKSCQGGGLCREHGGVRLPKQPVCVNYRQNSSHAHSSPQ